MNKHLVHFKITGQFIYLKKYELVFIYLFFLNDKGKYH